MVLALSLAAAVMLAVGFVLQQHEAARSAGEVLHVRLLLVLARRPIWLAGIGAMIVGQVLGATALGSGSLVVVEPLLSTNVLFALPLGALWSRRHLRGAEWAGALLLVGGLALFFVGGAPSSVPRDTAVPALAWLASGGGVVAFVLLLVSFARRQGMLAEATVLAAGAGVLFGLQDVLTQRSLLLLHHGLFALLTSWQPYTLVTVAIAGLTLSQSAFELAPLTASLPALTLGEPICGILLAVGLLGQRLRLGTLPLIAEGIGLLMMLLGVWMVARSPLVTDPSGRSRAPACADGETGTAAGGTGTAAAVPPPAN